MKVNGVAQTATVTTALLAKAESINHKTLYIEAENSQYKFRLKLISDYNNSLNSIPLGNYNVDNIQTAVFYAEFNILFKLPTGNTASYHHLGTVLYDVTSCDSNQKKVTASFSCFLDNGFDDDFYDSNVLIPTTVEITEGNIDNIEYTVTEY
ncbi:hypothetical protein GOQ30_04420 [Flavobacterium sp. TP390]|uniref:Uncharacterized protein n=1 Tax=Flavobacterium profundi TaxID=1774945 RepID=A0A6I4IFM3_9FLAO|nr:hypothetical protein [Flavobacterium profundi]MVO08408.1 hypothetical protein [Flavobacterium profundi]